MYAQETQSIIKMSLISPILLPLTISYHYDNQLVHLMDIKKTATMFGRLIYEVHALSASVLWKIKRSSLLEISRGIRS